jgi:hypothetical protein
LNQRINRALNKSLDLVRNAFAKDCYPCHA